MEPNYWSHIPEPADEIFVKDGHLRIRLHRLHNSWFAEIESEFEGRIFSGPVTEMSDLIINNSMVDTFMSQGNDGESNG